MYESLENPFLDPGVIGFDKNDVCESKRYLFTVPERIHEYKPFFIECLQDDFKKKIKHTLESRDILLNRHAKKNPNFIVESRFIIPNKKDKLFSSRLYAHIIGDDVPMPFRFIYCLNSNLVLSKILRAIRNTSVDFNHVKYGNFAVVGFISDSNNRELALKYFNLQHNQELANNLKSNVTGVGQYILYRYINKHTSYSTPEPHFASNNILCMESIRAGTRTLGEEIELNEYYGYEWLHWWLKIQHDIKKDLQYILELYKTNYWKPDYKAIDLHPGNIIIKEDYVNKPAPKPNDQNYSTCFYLIDPIN